MTSVYAHAGSRGGMNRAKDGWGARIVRTLKSAVEREPEFTANDKFTDALERELQRRAERRWTR